MPQPGFNVPQTVNTGWRGRGMQVQGQVDDLLKCIPAGRLVFSAASRCFCGRELWTLE